VVNELPVAALARKLPKDTAIDHALDQCVCARVRCAYDIHKEVRVWERVNRTIESPQGSIRFGQKNLGSSGFRVLEG